MSVFTTIEEATEAKKIDNTLQIVLTDCECCGKRFYVSREDLFKENVFRSEDDFKIDDRLSLIKNNFKCPHCGFAGMMTTNMQCKE